MKVTMLPCERLHPAHDPAACNACRRRAVRKLVPRSARVASKRQPIEKAKAKASSIRSISLPCLHEGAVLEWCHSCKAELGHVRDCELHERCTRGPNNGSLKSCSTCESYWPELPLSGPAGWQRKPEVRQAYSWASTRVMASAKPPTGLRGRGVVIAAGGSYWPSAYVTVRMLRLVGCDLPIECWYLGDRGERDLFYEAVMAPYAVTFHDADRHPLKQSRRGRLNGFELKLFAVMASAFEEVLFLDADCYPCQDPTPLFDEPRYAATGGVYWPDLPNTNRWTDWKFWGVEPFGPNAGFETGQYLVSKTKVYRQLALAYFYDSHSEWCYGIGSAGDHGDKGPHRVAWAQSRVAPAMYSLVPAWKSVAFLQSGPDGATPMFVHRCRSKLVLASTNFSTTSQNGVNLRAGLPLESEAFRFLNELRALRHDRQEHANGGVLQTVA